MLMKSNNDPKRHNNVLKYITDLFVSVEMKIGAGIFYAMFPR